MELTLFEIQQESLKILNDVHQFCTSHNIHYSLAYGTLLGAIRHKGFIPWDDDIDIMMPRPDYERFCALYKSELYKLIYSGNDKTCMLAFARVCDMRSTKVIGSTWTMESTGIWIDVFPIDGAEDNQSSFEYRYQKVRKQWKKLLRNRELAGGTAPFYSKKMNLLIKALNLFHLSFVNTIIEKSRRNYIIKCAKSIDFGSTGYACQMVCCDDTHRVPYPINVFDTFEELPFDGKYFMVASGYDTILKSDFGDYMKLPPISQQVPKQGNLKFTWINI